MLPIRERATHHAPAFTPDVAHPAAALAPASTPDADIFRVLAVDTVHPMCADPLSCSCL